MKTAAAIVLAIALISYMHKGHHEKPPAPFSKPPITVSESAIPSGEQAPGAPQSGSDVLPEYSSNDDQAKQQIIKFAKSQYRSLAVSDDTLSQIAAAIVKYSNLYGVDYALAAGLIARESKFNPNAVSSSGAKGLGQLIDSTAHNMGISDPFDIDQNLNGSIKYFKILMDKWAGDPNQINLALAGYLVGPRAVDVNSLSDKTKDYISSVLSARDSIKSM